MSATESCRIWGSSYPASVHINQYPSYAIVDSARTDGRYKFAGEAKLYINDLDDRAKARLTTWLVDQRTRGDELPEVTGAVIDHMTARPSLEVYERADRLLRFVAESIDTLGDHKTVSPKDCDAACAWSESIEWKEVHYLLRYLKAKGWVDAGTFQDNMFKGCPTIDGYNRIGERRINVDSSQAFIAMWFDPSINEVLEHGVEPAIREAGYKPLRIDKKEHINKIDDEIIAEIRRSRFLVADFTHGKDGARGGVYYEAGFALGLGIPVFYTCRNDQKNKLHMDTRQFNHLLWETYDELHVSLKNRILRVIGEGPGLHTVP